MACPGPWITAAWEYYTAVAYSWSFCRFVKKNKSFVFFLFSSVFVCSDFPDDLFFFSSVFRFSEILFLLSFLVQAFLQLIFYLCAAFCFQHFVYVRFVVRYPAFCLLVDAFCWIMQPDPPRSQPPFARTVSAANPSDIEGKKIMRLFLPEGGGDGAVSTEGWDVPTRWTRKRLLRSLFWDQYPADSRFFFVSPALKTVCLFLKWCMRCVICFFNGIRQRGENKNDVFAKNKKSEFSLSRLPLTL